MCGAADLVLAVLEPLFLVAEPVCLTVSEGPLEEPLFVLEALSVFEAEFVFVADGLCVCDAEDVLSLFELSFCLTTKESNSGSHRGQGHAAVKVERNNITSE